ncbi:hypothetical protein BCV70DRAFT_182633 [Testicularia cyperi]|uniref:Trs120-domain-containing protein n=1 Tax=Testicularia cyperi TaxID=1882483 RepID=A0A317XW15_9BASI|nr:hypothetical protein BCV70DRAFT_182633 [Testicularia cyperi]
MEQFAPTPSPIGGRSFIDHAKVRILLAPVGDVPEADFARWCDCVRTFETIRLADLPSSSTTRKSAAASASPILQTGEIHLSFVTSYDPDHSFLAPFNMHRQVLGVLGLTTYSNAVDRDELERSPSSLRELHPGAVIHRVFGFDSGAKRPETMDLSSMKDIVAAKIAPGISSRPGSSSGGGMTKSSSSSSISSESGFSGRKDGGLIIFPAVRKDGKDVRFYLKTLLAEFVASILDGLDQIVAGLEGTPLETPRETLEGITPNSAASGKSVSSALAAGVGAAASTAASRASSLFSFSSSSTSTTAPSSRPSSGVGGGSQPGDLGFSGGSSPGTASPSSESTRSKILAANANKKTKRVVSATTTGPMGSGRYAKIRADFHLLSGHLWEALDGYATSLTTLGKERAMAGGQDAVWFASALEGFSVARVLVSRMGGVILEKAPSFDLPWSGTDKEKEKEREKDGIPRPYAKLSWGEIAEAYTVALIIYAKCLAPPNILLEAARSVTNETPRDFTHPLIHASACVQYARLLLAVWASGGWNGECFDQLVYGGVPPALAETRPTSGDYLRFTSLSGVARHDIGAAASSALSHSVSALKSSDQITLLGTLTSIFGCIGFSRREAFMLRRLQNVVVSLIEKAIRYKSKQPETYSLPLQCRPDEGEVPGNLVAQITQDAIGRGPEAVLVLAMQVCETYGIHVEVEPLCNVPSFHILSRASEGLRSAYASPVPASEEWTRDGPGAGGQAKRQQRTPAQSTRSPQAAMPMAVVTPLEMQSEAAFGWKEQQISLLKESISIAEMLGDHLGMTFFATVLLRDFYALLSPDEQRDLVYGMQRTLQAARWQGAQELAFKYWGPPEPLCSLEFLALPTHRLPISKARSELQSKPTSADRADEGVAGLNNPFFWNPGGGRDSGIANKDQALAVQGENIELMATLQNPFSIDLEVEAIKLVTEGVAFNAHVQRAVLPPLSFQTVRLTGVASETGKLTVKGIAMQLTGCTEEIFLLPKYDQESNKARQSAAAEADDRRTRIKSVGLDARSSVMKQREAVAKLEAAAAVKKTAPPRSEPKYLQVEVVAPQPLISAQCPELMLCGALDMLEGEVQTIHVVLTNHSSELAVDHLGVRFTDDLSEATKQALADGELLPPDVHEVEWDLLHRPILQEAGQIAGFADAASASRDRTIQPNDSIVIPVQIRAKLGCSTAKIVVEYAHLGNDSITAESQQHSATRCHVRRLELGFGVTVHPVLECGAVEISPLRAAEAARLTAESLATSQAASSIGMFADGSNEEDDGGESSLIAAAVNGEYETTYCLISLDLTNVWNLDVMVRFSLNTGGVAPLQLHRIIRPGQTSRFVLPLPRLTLTEEELSRPIPSLSQQRQFIVSRVTYSEQEERLIRRRFWYRHNLLARFNAVWRSVSPSSLYGLAEDALKYRPQFGSLLSLRQAVEIETRHLDVLRHDPLGVAIRFEPQIHGNDSDAVHADEFVTASVKVRNRSGRGLKLVVRLVPVSPAPALDPSALSQVIIADGTASSTIRLLDPGMSATVDFQVMFLSTGIFGFVAHIEEVALPDLAPADLEASSRPRDRISFVSPLAEAHVLA